PLYNPAAGITDCNSAGVTPVGLVFPGDKGVPNGLTDTYYKAFAPRLGINWILNPTRGQAIDWSSFRSILLYGQFPQQLRTQYSAQYNLTVKRELPGNILLQVGYVGSQGHRLLASYDLNHGNPNTCNDLAAIASLPANAGLGLSSCGPQSADNSYFLPAGTVIPS